ncbi:MAG: aminotransferase class V-fold PLP-dependent enzyme, partial [Anaerolineaceae bacterium]|nr:aminotransferase class V-fold PLP-dependent enzyme [Anaerolineaceae bacterium]
MKTVYQELGLPRIINASGRMTALGVSTASETTAEALRAASQNYVEIAALMDAAGKRIAAVTGGEDACPTAGAAAGIAVAVAGCIAKGSIAITQRLPDSQGLANEVILQKGQSINFGASIPQMILLGGGKPVEVGSANHTQPEQISDAIGPNTAALMYVVSHHCVQKGVVGLAEIISIVHEAKLPVIVDAAAEEDLRKYVALGADLVIYSGSKAIEGPISGFVTGRADLIASCKMQSYGIARPMKIGKEGIVGLLAALDHYVHRDTQAIKRAEKEKIEYLYQELSKLESLKCTLAEDSAGREIT